MNLEFSLKNHRNGLTAVGLIWIVAGFGLISLPVGLIIGGMILVGLAYLLGRPDPSQSLQEPPGSSEREKRIFR